MSELFSISELLTLAVFAAGIAVLLAKAAPRPQTIPVDQIMAARLMAGRPRRSASRTEADFPSAWVC